MKKTKNPLIPMVAVTGHPNETAIFRYMSNMQRHGFEQVMLYPRAGCEISYLSEEWFAVIGFFLKAAQNLDMRVWLYDDFNWPSGDAAGRVTANPNFRLKAMTTKGENFGQVSCQSQHNASLFGEKWFPDLLSSEAVEAFIGYTHEEYYRRFPEYFGSIIPGIFTDEPSIGYCCTETSIPYYDGLENDYFAHCGRPFLSDMKEGAATFYQTVVERISDRFRKCYLEKLADWCTAHGILMTGHLMGDDNPLFSARYSGDFLKNLSVFPLPGIDDITTDFHHALTHFSAIEYAAGNNGAMAELFALGPCDMTYAKKRCMLYYAACHKIDHYFLAISHLDMRGNRLIRDFLNNFMTDQPDFIGMKQLAAEAEIAVTYAHGDFTPDVYIQYPHAVCAGHICDTLTVSPYERLMKRLVYHQLQWKLLTEGEDNHGIPVIRFTEDMKYSLNGEVTDEVDVICSRIGSNKRVTTMSGERPEGLFVRYLTDGRLLVLNLTGERGDYLIDGKKCFLETHGVYRSNEVPSISAATTPKPLETDFSLSYENDNVVRAMFVNEQTKAILRVNEPMEVRFAVRADTDLTIDGEAVATSSNDPCLSDGLRALYLYSEPILLNCATHTLQSRNDFKFLPSVFIVGNFKADTHSGAVCEVVLSSRKSTYTVGERLTNYGKVIFSAQVTVPFNAVALELCGVELYTEVQLKDAPLGGHIATPYCWAIDKSLQGQTVSLRITQYSDMGSVFGDVAYYDKNAKNVSWKNTPSMMGTTMGFQTIRWLIE